MDKELDKVLFDINILRTVLLWETRRGAQSLSDAQEAWEAAEKKKIEGWVAAFLLPIIFSQCENYYKVEIPKELAGISPEETVKRARARAYTNVRRCIKIFRLCELIVDDETNDIAEADELMTHYLSCNDFEDNLQMVCAYQTGIRIIVTDNVPDFTCAMDEFGIRVLSLNQFVTHIRSQTGS